MGSDSGRAALIVLAVLGRHIEAVIRHVGVLMF